MPDVTVKRVEDFEAIFGGGFRRARAGLGVSSFGLAVIDLPANFSHFPEHDQTHDDQEEVYTVVSGRATLRVGGEEYELEPGVFARVGATEKRKLITGDEPARIIAMGAMPGQGLRAARVHQRGHQAALDGGDQVEERDAGALAATGPST